MKIGNRFLISEEEHDVFEQLNTLTRKMYADYRHAKQIICTKAEESICYELLRNI